MSLTGIHNFSECPQCHAPLASNAGDCSRCLWSSLNGDHLEDSQSNAATMAPLERPKSAAPSLVGQNIGGYVLIEQIGQGGMGVVWKARQVTPTREVAIKMMKGAAAESGEFRARFELEARALAVLDHPSILPLFGYGEEAGMAWFTMKLASGGNLALRRKSYTGKWRESAELIRKLAGALQYAHDRGVLHRDMKPANVLFDDKGEPYIADFGLAKLVGETSVLDGSLAVLGTPAYMAPEIAAADARAATTSSDVYGLGATFYELLAGRPPYAAKSLHDMLQEITSTDPVPPSRQSLLANTHLPAVPRDLDVICMKCLARDPAKRYESARDLAEDLERWLDGRPIAARQISRTERAWAWACRNPVVAALSSALLLALLAGGSMLFVKNRELSTALTSASEARDDAEERIEFMTRNLGGKMQSFGQLTLLNDVFADVARYYDTRPADASDANAIERRITFLLKAGEVLMPQGKLDAALVKFNEAIHQAETAAQHHPQNNRFRVLQLDGHRLAGQAIMENQGAVEAMKVLQRGLDRFPNPKESSETAARAALLTVAARSTSHLASQAEAREDPNSAPAIASVRLAEEAVELCRSLVKMADTPDNQATLATALEGLGVVLKESADRHKKQKSPSEIPSQEFARALAAFQEMRDLYAAASKTVEENLPWQRRVGEAENWLASIHRRQGNFPEAKAHLAKQRAIMEPLLAAEPLNGDWQIALVLNAWAEGEIAKAEANDEAHSQWIEKQVEISTRLTNQNPSVRMWWVHHQLGLIDLRDDLASTDPERASSARRRSAEAALRANELQATPDEFKTMIYLIKQTIRDLEENSSESEKIAFTERVVTRFLRTADNPETKQPEAWLEGAVLLQMKLAMWQRTAGDNSAADDAEAAAWTNCFKVLTQSKTVDSVIGLIKEAVREREKNSSEPETIAFTERVVTRFLRTADNPETKQPEAWLEEAMLLQMKLAMWQRTAGDTPAADAAVAAAWTTWRKILTKPTAVESAAGAVRSQARRQVEAAIAAGDGEQALAATGRWLEFTSDLAANPVPGWRAGWLRLIGDVGKNIQANLSTSFPQAKEFCQAWLGKLTSASPAISFNKEEQEAMERIQKLLGQ